MLAAPTTKCLPGERITHMENTGERDVFLPLGFKCRQHQHPLCTGNFQIGTSSPVPFPQPLHHPSSCLVVIDTVTLNGISSHCVQGTAPDL